jgi:hypothetical protein
LEYFGDSVASLVDHELRHHEQSARATMTSRVRERIPVDALPQVEALVSRWEEKGREQAFWQRPVARFATEMVPEIQQLLTAINQNPQGELNFVVLHLLVLRLADRAHDEPELRTLMGLRGGFPRTPRRGTRPGEGNGQIATLHRVR